MDLMTYALLKKQVTSSGGTGSSGSGANISWKEAPDGGILISLNGTSKILAKQDDLISLQKELDEDITKLQKQIEEKGGNLTDLAEELQIIKATQATIQSIQDGFATMLTVQDTRLTNLESDIYTGEIQKDTLQKIQEVEDIIAALSSQVAANQTELSNSLTALQTKVNSTTSATSAALSTIKTDVSNLKTAVKNLENGDSGEGGAGGGFCNFVFDTLSDMNSWLEDPENLSSLQPGSHLFIKEYDVSDYWWDGERVQQIEIQPPDMSNYVRKSDYATDRTVGLVQGSTVYGVTITQAGVLQIATPNKDTIAKGTNQYLPLTPAVQDQAVFYGLGKAAGISSNNIEDKTKGGYTESAQLAIQALLGLKRQYLTEEDFNALKELDLLDSNTDYYVYEEE